MKFNITIFVLKDKRKNLNHTQWNWDSIWTYHTRIRLHSKASSENYEIRVATWVETRNCTATKSKLSMATQFFVAEGEDQSVPKYKRVHRIQKIVGYRNNCTGWNLEPVRGKSEISHLLKLVWRESQHHSKRQRNHPDIARGELLIGGQQLSVLHFFGAARQPSCKNHNKKQRIFSKSIGELRHAH